MKQELVRINSLDGIEEVGILYTPIVKTKKIVIHVHGMNGNFYENRFLDILASTYVAKGYAFLTFNNRGREFITELLQKDGFVTIGGCKEKFVDCLLDIGGVVNWVKEKEYSEIILEGHSYGCNKVLYYYYKKKEECIKQIVLLAPCDIPAECKKFMRKEEYLKAKKESENFVKENKIDELIECSLMTNGTIASGTFYYDFLPNGENDFLKYREKTNGTNEVLKSIDIPTLIVFGDEDECVLTEKIDVVKDYLAKNIEMTNIQIIAGANHSYSGKYKELGEIIEINM